MSSEEDDSYFLPPALEIDNINDICKNKNLSRERFWETPSINVKHEPSAELWEEDSLLSPTRSNSFSQTSLTEENEPTISEVLQIKYEDERDFFGSPKIFTYDNENSLSENGSTDTLEYLSTKIFCNSKEAFERKTKTEILKEKEDKTNPNELNDELRINKADPYTYPLQKESDISDLNTRHNKTEAATKIANSDNTTRDLNNNSTVILCNILHNEDNGVENEKLQLSMSKVCNINAKFANESIISNSNVCKYKETSPFDIQNSNNPLGKILESREIDINKTHNTSRNDERYFEHSSTKECNTKLKSCNNNDLKSSIEIEKDSVNQCLKNWKKYYPWVSLEEDSLILSCNVCSYESKPLHILQIKTSSDKFHVGKYLRDHNILQKHRFLSHFGNFDIFQKVYKILKGVSHAETFASKFVFYRDIKSIISNNLGSTIDEPDINFFIHTIALVIKESVISKIQSRKHYGISFVCDPCRRILIAKFFDSQNYPRECLITSYIQTNPLVTPYEFLHFYGLEIARTTFFKFMTCSDCLPQPSATSGCKENTLPLLLPEIDEFLGLMRKCNTIKVFETLMFSLLTIYNKNPRIFQSLNGHTLLERPMWGESRLISFFCENYWQIKSIFISNMRDNLHLNQLVKYFMDLVLDTNKTTLIAATSDMVHYIGIIGTNYEYFKSEIKNKMENYFVRLKSNEVFLSTHEEAINVLSLYYKEIINENYYCGLRNISDFTFLFDPMRMANLLANGKTAGDDRTSMDKIWYLLHQFIPLPIKPFNISLVFFGKDLLKVSSRRNYSLHDIIELFNNTPELKMNYPWILHFYAVLGTLPVFRSKSNKSLAFVSAMKNDLERHFDYYLSNSLLTIVTEGPAITGDDISVLYNMAMSKIFKS